MPKEKIDLREELRLYKFEFDLLQKIPCSKTENKEYQKSSTTACQTHWGKRKSGTY